MSRLPTLDAVLRGLVDPLWPPIAAMVVVWVVLWRGGSLRRWMKVVGTAAVTATWAIATPFTALVLERPLVVESEESDDWRPQVIYVLGAGFELGDRPADDTPSLESAQRVSRAVALWRRHPTATLVMAGIEPGKGRFRDPARLGQLMRARAEQLGVPADRIVLDSVSTNTNGHAKAARDSGLHAADAPIAVVSSDYHLRRAKREFSRFFTDIRTFGSDPEITDPSFRTLGVGSFLPQARVPDESRRYLREYVALALSDLRN